MTKKIERSRDLKKIQDLLDRDQAFANILRQTVKATEEVGRLANSTPRRLRLPYASAVPILSAPWN